MLIYQIVYTDQKWSWQWGDRKSSTRVRGRPSRGQSNKKRLETCGWRWKQKSHKCPPRAPCKLVSPFPGQEPWASALTIATLLRTLRQVKAAVKPPARKGGETQRKINREKMTLRWCRFLGKQLGTCSYSCSGTLRKVTHLVQPFIPGIYQKEGSWIP